MCVLVWRGHREKGEEGREERTASRKPHFSDHSSRRKASSPEAGQPKRDWYQKHGTTYKADVLGKPVQPLSGHFLEFCCGQQPRLTRKQNSEFYIFFFFSPPGYLEELRCPLLKG